MVGCAYEWKEIDVAKKETGSLAIFMVCIHVYILFDQPVLDIVIDNNHIQYGSKKQIPIKERLYVINIVKSKI